MTPIHLCRVTRKGRRMLSIVCAWPINAPSFSAITPPDERLLRYYCTYTPDHVPPHYPAPSELGLQPLFFVQPCSVATSAAHPTRHFHPLGFQNERKIKRRAQKEEKRSESGVKKRLPRHVETSVFPSGDFGRFSHRLYVSFHRCLYFLSFCRAFLLYYSYSFLHGMPWIFNSMDLLWIKVSLFSRNRIRYLAVSRTIFFILVAGILISPCCYALVTIRSRQRRG